MSALVEIDEYGRVMGKGIHDAIIYEFRYVLGSRFDVCVRNESTNIWLLLADIYRIGFKDVIDGTILSDVYCWNLGKEFSSITSEAWKALLGEGYVLKDIDVVRSKIATSYSGHNFVYFESSYGGFISVICGSLDISAERPY